MWDVTVTLTPIDVLASSSSPTPKEQGSVTRIINTLDLTESSPVHAP